MNQKEIVYEIVKNAGSQGIRSEQVKIQAMKKGVSCADRYLRWLQEENKVESCKKPGDKTFTWYICKPDRITYLNTKTGKETEPESLFAFNTREHKPLTMGMIQADRRKLDMILQ